jgi:hypothetical protein
MRKITSGLLPAPTSKTKEGLDTDQQSADAKQTMRAGAIESSARVCHGALNHGFDDAYLLMDKLKPDQDNEMVQRAMQSVRQTLGSMIIAAVVVKRIEEYLATRPNHVRVALSRTNKANVINDSGTKEQKTDPELVVCQELKTDYQELISGIETGRKQLSALRGTLLQLQSASAKELLTNDLSASMKELEAAQEAAFNLDKLNKRAIAVLES